MKDLPSLTPKPGKALLTSRLQPGAVSMYHEFIFKMALGFHLSYRKVLETSEGPFHPCGHRAASQDAAGTDLSQEMGLSQNQSFNHPSRGPPRGHNQQTRGPRPERALQGHAGNNLGSPAKTTTLIIGERRAPGSPTLPFPSRTRLCLSHIVRYPAWEVLPEVRGTQA